MSDEKLMTLVPPDLQVRLEELAQKMCDTIKYSTKFDQGPQLTIQMILLTLVRLGMVSNPDIMNKLQIALQIAHGQVLEEQN